MATADYHADPYVRQLNAWHLELSMLADLVTHIMDNVDGPEWVTSSAHIAQERFAYLRDSFPFPPELHHKSQP